MDFHALPRRDLQALCKRNGVRANMTNAAMADALNALASVDGIEEFGAQLHSLRTPAAKSAVKAVVEEQKEQQGSPLPRGRRVTFKSPEPIRLESNEEEEAADLKRDAVKEIVGTPGVSVRSSSRRARAAPAPAPTTRRRAAASKTVDCVEELPSPAPAPTARRKAAASKTVDCAEELPTLALAPTTRRKAAASKTVSCAEELPTPATRRRRRTTVAAAEEKVPRRTTRRAAAKMSALEQEKEEKPKGVASDVEIIAAPASDGRCEDDSETEDATKEGRNSSEVEEEPVQQEEGVACASEIGSAHDGCADPDKEAESNEREQSEQEEEGKVMDAPVEGILGAQEETEECKNMPVVEEQAVMEEELVTEVCEHESLVQELVSVEELVTEECKNEPLVDEQVSVEELVTEEFKNDPLVQEQVSVEELVMEGCKNEPVVHEQAIVQELLTEECKHESVVQEQVIVEDSAVPLPGLEDSPILGRVSKATEPDIKEDGDGPPLDGDSISERSLEVEMTREIHLFSELEEELVHMDEAKQGMVTTSHVSEEREVEADGEAWQPMAAEDKVQAIMTDDQGIEGDDFNSKIDPIVKEEVAALNEVLLVAVTTNESVVEENDFASDCNEVVEEEEVALDEVLQVKVATNQAVVEEDDFACESNEVVGEVAVAFDEVLQVEGATNEAVVEKDDFAGESNEVVEEEAVAFDEVLQVAVTTNEDVVENDDFVGESNEVVEEEAAAFDEVLQVTVKTNEAVAEEDDFVGESNQVVEDEPVASHEMLQDIVKDESTSESDYVVEEKQVVASSEMLQDTVTIGEAIEEDDSTGENDIVAEKEVQDDFTGGSNQVVQEEKQVVAVDEVLQGMPSANEAVDVVPQGTFTAQEAIDEDDFSSDLPPEFNNACDFNDAKADDGITSLMVSEGEKVSVLSPGKSSPLVVHDMLDTVVKKLATTAISAEPVVCDEKADVTEEMKQECSETVGVVEEKKETKEKQNPQDWNALSLRKLKAEYKNRLVAVKGAEAKRVPLGELDENAC